MLKRLLMIVVSLFSLVSLTYAQVEIVDSGEKEEKHYLRKKNELTRIDRNISVKNQGPVNYGLQYYYYPDPSIRGEKISKSLAEWVKFPYIGDPTTRTTGLGLTGGAWYSYGFLGIDINGKTLTRTLAKEIKVVEQGRRGVIDVLWKPEWAEIKARFVFLPEDDKVYTEITLAPKVEVESIKIQLFCIPGYHTEPIDHCVSTAKRHIQQSKKHISLNCKEEPWIYGFRTTSKGPACAVMYLPEEVVEASIYLHATSFYQSTLLTVSPEVRKIHLIFWNFPRPYKKSSEDIYNYLKENGEELLENLRKFKFDEVFL